MAGIPSNAAFTASAPGTVLNDPFMEWTNRRPADVMDHHALGYAYDTEPVVTGPAPSGPDMLPGGGDVGVEHRREAGGVGGDAG